MKIFTLTILLTATSLGLFGQDVSYNTITTTSLDSANPTSIRIIGQNSPVLLPSARNISFEFNSAGKAYIRAFRGSSWGTHLQFLTSDEVTSGGIPKVRLHISSEGNVGIGTSNPGSPLSISGNGTGVSVSPGGAPYYGTLAFNRESATGTIFDPSGSAFQINNGGTDANLHFTVWKGNGTMVTSNALVIGADGNIGIGVSNSKGYRLAVAGNMIAESVKVQLQSAWPDYVFAKDYTLLPSLKETEKHIKEKGHLPGIPSAAEVKTNGIDVGEMNAKLLQKIEELTLYVINLNKKSSSQEIMVKKLQNEVKKLKSKK
ncbi:hypothetical protein DBR11_26325 [Pedobacter sp. HMWF019]|uniref:hypothetical protein n=1 Tax=Pedobacter sp. HMWF019 TaxID=2056856 RepID=UPI000D385624|nr:hypothetical protein [Pedobacter sp. HMWF019]PTS92775.1 hypothetical protein DBR11_26325 [Pedobacter sp. HMWF019]